MHKGCGYSIFCIELSVGIIGIYGISSYTFHIHELLLHTNAVLKPDTFVECPELNGFGFLTSDDYESDPFG